MKDIFQNFFDLQDSVVDLFNQLYPDGEITHAAARHLKYYFAIEFDEKWQAFSERVTDMDD